MPGSIAYTMDNLDAYEIAGTIAGDDTILIIPRDGVSRADLDKPAEIANARIDQGNR